MIREDPLIVISSSFSLVTVVSACAFVPLNVTRVLELAINPLLSYTTILTCSPGDTIGSGVESLSPIVILLITVVDSGANVYIFPSMCKVSPATKVALEI